MKDGSTAHRPGTLFIRTFGCQMNDAESERVRRMLEARGFTVTEELEGADVVFVNTCTVREKAEQKACSFLGRVARAKRRNSGMTVITGGCLAQQEGARLLSRIAGCCDVVVGTRGLSALPRLLLEAKVSRRPIVHLPENPEPEDAPPEVFRAPGVTARVSIMQGCDNFCSYCIVPHVRGRERSRAPQDLLREAKALVASGAKELMLLGQNVNSYGRGLAPETDFPSLLRLLARESGTQRIRFTTSHPKDLSERLIECFATLPELALHLHLPFQSGSDRILSLMNRGYTAEDYMRKVARLRAAAPDIALTADCMVGFPGETEDDFRATLSLMETVRFDALFSFRYSDRPPARAVSFPGKVESDVKSRRLAWLQALQARITTEKMAEEVGKARIVLVEGESRAGGGQLTGRTPQNRIVNFRGGPSLTGRMVPVRITAALPHSLAGEPASP